MPHNFETNIKQNAKKSVFNKTSKCLDSLHYNLSILQPAMKIQHKYCLLFSLDLWNHTYMNSKPVSEQLAKTFVQTRMIEILFYSNCLMGRSLGGIVKVIFVLFFVQYPLQPVLPSCIYEAGVLSSGQGNQSRNR